MRRIVPTRTFGDRRTDDVQFMINEQPATAAVSRPGGNTLTGAGSMTSIGSFECRIDMLALGPRYLEQKDDAGRTSTLTYRLTACPTTDKNGNAVNIKHNDKVVVGSQEFVCVYVHPLPWMLEAILEVRQ